MNEEAAVSDTVLLPVWTRSNSQEKKKDNLCLGTLLHSITLFPLDRKEIVLYSLSLIV